MKKAQLVISGIALLIAGIGSATATGSLEGGMYDDLHALHQELQANTTIARGAQGPIRSFVDVQPSANDVYESVHKYQAAQQFDQMRGAQGPIRSDSDMTMDRNQRDWKNIVGIFTGSD